MLPDAPTGGAKAQSALQDHCFCFLLSVSFDQATPALPGLLAFVHAGFGRIGRLVLRATLDRKDVKVVAINGKFAQALQAPAAAISELALSTLRHPSDRYCSAVTCVQTPSSSPSMPLTCSR